MVATWNNVFSLTVVSVTPWDKVSVLNDLPIFTTVPTIGAATPRKPMLSRNSEGRTRKVDVRVVAATNQDLFALTKTRQFRADLYYRLSVFPVSSPPLRERAENVPILARFFLERFARKLNLRRVPQLTKAQARELSVYHWPGNVRELENTVERAHPGLGTRRKTGVRSAVRCGVCPE